MPGAAAVMPYLGPEWGAEALRRMRSDARVAAAVRGVRASVLTRITDAPPGRYAWLYARFDGTALADARLGHEGDGQLDGLPRPTFTVRGPYAAFAAIQRGELTQRRAVLSGRLHVAGSRLQAIRHMGALEAVTGVLAEIPCST